MATSLRIEPAEVVLDLRMPDTQAEQMLRQTVTLTNRGESPLMLGSVAAGCGCVATGGAAGCLAGGESCEVPLTINRRSFTGNQSVPVRFTLRDGSTRECVVRSVAEVVPPQTVRAHVVTLPACGVAVPYRTEFDLPLPKTTVADAQAATLATWCRAAVRRQEGRPVLHVTVDAAAATLRDAMRGRGVDAVVTVTFRTGSTLGKVCLSLVRPPVASIEPQLLTLQEGQGQFAVVLAGGCDGWILEGVATAAAGVHFETRRSGERAWSVVVRLDAGVPAGTRIAECGFLSPAGERIELPCVLVQPSLSHDGETVGAGDGEADAETPARAA